MILIASVGHVFCYDCIVRVVRNVQPFTQQHFCPTCRTVYTICTSQPPSTPRHNQTFFLASQITSTQTSFPPISVHTSHLPSEDYSLTSTSPARLQVLHPLWSATAFGQKTPRCAHVARPGENARPCTPLRLSGSSALRGSPETTR